MMHARVYFAVAVVVATQMLGCAPHVFDSSGAAVGMIEGDNTHRYAVFGNSKDKAGGVKICMESVGPAAMTHRFDAFFAMKLQNEQNLDGSGKGKGKGADGTSADANARFAYRNFQDLGLRAGITYQDQLAQLFTVDDIMQFAHESLYRLCEARANGVLGDEQYNKLFSSTLEKATSLIQQQMQNQLALDSARLSAAIQLLAEARRSEAARKDIPAVDLQGKPVALDIAAKQKEHDETIRSIDGLMRDLTKEHKSTVRALRGGNDSTIDEDSEPSPGGGGAGSEAPVQPGGGAAQPDPPPGPKKATPPPRGLPPPPKPPQGKKPEQ